MGANNWGICPKCKLIGLKRQQQLHNDVENAYGKVSSKEYRKLFDKSNVKVKEEETLAEYYELGMYNIDEHFYVSYKASCDKCGFKYRFTCQKEINLND